MRCMTVTQAKNPKMSRMHIGDKPPKGTKIREIYDLFTANKGNTVFVIFKAPSGRIVDCLQDEWGLDIRNLSRGQWVLAGEWFGKVYVDYIAERMEKAG